VAASPLCAAHSFDSWSDFVPPPPWNADWDVIHPFVAKRRSTLSRVYHRIPHGMAVARSG
jgi:hypothetical protein